MKIIVITGATSMIGTAIVKSCLEHEVEKIYAVIRPEAQKTDRLPIDERIVKIECSIDNYKELPRLIKEKCDVFYHIAWSITGDKRNANIEGQADNIRYTLDAMQAANDLGCKKFIGAGSQAEYGKLDIEKISENSPTNPVQPYGIAKFAAGKLAMEKAKQIGISCFWVRIFSIYGIYDKPTTMISKAISKMLSGEKASFTKAEQRWEYLHSDDAGEAFYLIGEKSEGQKVYCLGNGKARILREYIEILRNSIDTSAEIGIGDIPYTENTVMNLCADISLLQKDTGWQPAISFEEGVKQVIEFKKSSAN